MEKKGSLTAYISGFMFVGIVGFGFYLLFGLFNYVDLPSACIIKTNGQAFGTSTVGVTSALKHLKKN